MADLEGFMGFDNNEQQQPAAQENGGLNFDNNEDPFQAAGVQMNNQDDLASGFQSMNFSTDPSAAGAPILSPGIKRDDDYTEEELAIIQRVQEEDAERKR